MIAPVSIVRCRDYAPYEVRRALAEALEPLGGMGAFVQPGERILLKPNLLSPRSPEAAVTTHPEVMRAVATEVIAAGGVPCVGDSPPLHSLGTLLDKTGIGEVVRELRLETVEFKTPREVPGPKGGTFRVLELAAEALAFGKIINLPKLKTHGQMTLTLAVKNLFGLVVGMAKPAWHLRAGSDPRFADLLLDIALAVPPALNIMDGVVGMEGNGPSAGVPRDLGLLAASPSALAMDTAVAVLLGVDEHLFPLLARAKARGILPTRESIILPRLSLAEAAVADFALPASATRLTWMLPDLPRRVLRRQLSSFPEIEDEACTLCVRCEEVCPVGAMRRGKEGMRVDRSRCIGCFCCQEMCPENAIEPVPGRMLKFLKRVKLA